MTAARRAVVVVSMAGLFAFAWSGVSAQRAAAPVQIPTHPRDLKYAPLAFEPPEPSAYRRVLANKVVAYMVEDHELPLVNVAVMMRGGSYVEPKGKEGLASAVGSQMRAGGAGDLTAEQFDEEADFLAAGISAGLGSASGSASVNFLAKDADHALQLFFDMLRRPRFQEDRFKLYKTQVLQNMERRNDSTDGIESREWTRLIRGTDHFTTASSTKASIESLTRDDLVAFHQKWVHPGNFVLAVSGDFKSADLQAKLEKAMAAWTSASQAAAPPVPKPAHTPAAGIYMVNKADVNQGRVSIGHLGIVRGDPDEVAIEMMNDVLGGSGFTSRITNRVRSDEGLAYSAGSSFSPGDYYPGTFRASFQSKSATVAQATQIVIDEVLRMRKEKVSEEELETVRNYAINVFPRSFASAGAIASLYATDELVGRDPKYWKTYRSRVGAVTTDEVKRVAEKYLHPDTLVILVVGNVDDMLKGNPDKPQYSLDKIAGGKTIVRIPLPNPLTMKYPDK